MPGKLTPSSGLDQPLTDRYPRVMPGRLTPPSRDKPVDLDAVKRHVENAPVTNGAMVKIPGAPQPLFARILPDHILGFDYDHMELVPGGQVTLPGVNPHLRSHQDAFSLTLQSIYQRGPDDGPNNTLTWGANFTLPETWLGGDPGPWTLAPFIQLTDVDRFWHVGNWHFWQPYAQVGAQFNLSRPVQPSATGALFPVNIGYDLNDDVTFQFASGLTFTLDVSSGQFTAARQATFGVSIKFGKPKK